MITLKDFQNKMIDKLLNFTSPNYGVDEIHIKAPTGSGKTICLLSWIDSYIASTQDDVAFIWFTPGAGELEEQSYKKSMDFHNIKSQTIDDALLHGFEKGTTTFINYERVIGKNSKIMLSESEKDNLNDVIYKAFQKNINFILIIDEAHRNDTNKARDIIGKFNASKMIKVSATISDPNQADEIEYYEVSEEAVIQSGLITKSVIVNDLLDIDRSTKDEVSTLLEAAENKRIKIVSEYKSNKKEINPLVIVQLPDESSDNLIDKVEDYLKNNLNKSYENKTLGIWLSNRKINNKDVESLESSVEYLIIKQAIATGWDAPRAKVLVKLRENMGESFTIQTIGRIRRMPEPNKGHYGIDLLDNSYLYTFDTDFLDGAFSQGGAVIPTPLLTLKDNAKSLTLNSQRIKNKNLIINEKQILDNIYNGIKQSLNLNDSMKRNKEIFENHGYYIGDKIRTSYKQGRFDTLDNSDALFNRERWIEADYYNNRLDLIHVFHEIGRVIHLPVSKVESLLKMFFMASRRFTKHSLLSLNTKEWTAFILNNWKNLRDEFREIDTNVSIQSSFDYEDNITDSDFTIPLKERYTYNPIEKNEVIVTNAYENYWSSCIDTRPSLVERLFERYIEQNKEIIDFVYKNGDKGPQYFSLVYGTNGGISHFYPDFIIKLKNEEIYIVETKGGEDQYGNDKNIDPYSHAKFNSLKNYGDKHNLKWAFIRDKNEKLYFLNQDEWLDDMSNSNWKEIDYLFNFKNLD